LLSSKIGFHKLRQVSAHFAHDLRDAADVLPFQSSGLAAASLISSKEARPARRRSTQDHQPRTTP